MLKRRYNVSVTNQVFDCAGELEARPERSRGEKNYGKNFRTLGDWSIFLRMGCNRAGNDYRPSTAENFGLKEC